MTPVSMAALPPGRTLPENASCSDFDSDSSFVVFTDEIANRTMNSARSSVIMSAYVSEPALLVLVLALVVAVRLAAPAVGGHG